MELEVHTGSTYTALPRKMFESLGVPVDASIPARLADGRQQMLEIGEARIRLGGREFTTIVIFAEEGEPSLLGVITLEEALLAVDPAHNELIPVEAKRF
jgi:predicted aspartyl protease